MAKRKYSPQFVSGNARRFLERGLIELSYPLSSVSDDQIRPAVIEALRKGDNMSSPPIKRELNTSYGRQLIYDRIESEIKAMRKISSKGFGEMSALERRLAQKQRRYAERLSKTRPDKKVVVQGKKPVGGGSGYTLLAEGIGISDFAKTVSSFMSGGTDRKFVSRTSNDGYGVFAVYEPENYTQARVDQTSAWSAWSAQKAIDGTTPPFMNFDLYVSKDGKTQKAQFS